MNRRVLSRVAIALGMLALTSGVVTAQSGDTEVQKGIEFAVHDGGRLTGDLYTPKAPGKYAAIIAMHGGGWQIGNPGAYRYWGPYLAQRGYALFAISYRLSRPGEKTFPHAVHDVRAAVQFLRSKGPALKVDPDRLGLMGDSAGAHLAALVALAGDHPTFASGYPGDPYARVSTKVKVAVTIYGVYDMYEQWKHDLLTRPRDNIVEKFLGASPLDNRRVYFDASPLSYTTQDGNASSFLVVWGTEDDIVDVRTQSEAFMLALKQARFFVRPVVIQGAPHFWVWDPVDEPDSHNGFLAPRLLRFLAQRLAGQ